MNNEQQCREAFERELIKKYGLNEDQAKTFFNDMGYEYEIYQAGYNAKAQESQWVSVEEKLKELASAINSINRHECHLVPEEITGDDEPCYWQRKEWIEWMLELAEEAKELLPPKEQKEK